MLLSMKAWIVQKHGSNEVLNQKDIPQPKPKNGEARVKVCAVGLNHLDLWVRNGVPGHHFPLPLIPGCDVSGIVDCFGKLSNKDKLELKKKNINEGDGVIVNPIVSCGHCETCQNGFAAICKDFGLLGETTNGGCTDYLCISIRQLEKKPKSLTFEQAASIQIPGITAWSMLFRKANLKKGEWILIQAGGSAVSLFAIQLALNVGAKVITTTSSPKKERILKKMGVKHVLFYNAPDFLKKIRKILKKENKRGVDVVLDHVGVKTFTQSLKSLDWGGRLVTCGATTGAEIAIDLKPLFFKNISIFGSTMGDVSDLKKIILLISRKKITSIIDSVYSMEDLPEALSKIESKNIFGKVVLKNY